MTAATLSRSDEKSAPPSAPRPEPKILYQTFFKSIGTRTYAAQVKQASNGNHFIALTEGRRDEKTGDLRKNFVLVFGEDFEAFFKMLDDTKQFVHQHPVPADIAKKQARFWENKRKQPSANKAGETRRQN